MYKHYYAVDPPSGAKYPVLIEVQSPLTAALDVFKIRNNPMLSTAFTPKTASTSADPIYGIKISGNSDGYDVQGNSIDFTDSHAPDQTVESLAISVFGVNGKNNSITSNNRVNGTFNFPAVTDETMFSWINCGLHIADSPNWVVCGNNVDNTNRGGHFDGNSDYCDFANNALNNHFHGILCSTPTGMTTDIGHQYFHQNTWPTGVLTGDRTHALYRDLISTIPGVPNGTPLFNFWVDIATTPPAGRVYSPATVNPAMGWFIQGPFDPEYENSSCIASVGPAGLTGHETRILANEQTWSFASSEWDDKRRLLGKLIEQPLLRPSGSAAATFYALNLNGSAWSYAMSDWKIDEATRISTSLNTRLVYWIETSDFTEKEIVRLDSLLEADPTSPNAAAWEADKQSNNSLSAIATDSLQIIYGEVETFRNGKLDDAKTWTNSLSQSTAWEENYRNRQLIRIKLAKGFELDSADMIILRAIGEQCPQTGGEIVRYAPLLLPVEETRQYQVETWFDGCLASGGQSRNSASKPEEKLTDWKVFPNPTSDGISVVFEKPVIGTWTLKDLSGRLLLSGKVETAQSELFIGQLRNHPDGHYLLTFIDQEGTARTAKVAILH